MAGGSLPSEEPLKARRSGRPTRRTTTGTRRCGYVSGRWITPPVLLVHGWGGSYDLTWAQTPLVPLLEDAGRRVIGVDLLGHGEAPKPHDPEAYADLTLRIEEALPDEPVDAVGFSLGAITLLAARPTAAGGLPSHRVRRHRGQRLRPGTQQRAGSSPP